MKQYWVVGGRYKDTSFSEILEGHSEQRSGPYDSYEAAKSEWQRLAWQAVDDAHSRYFIEEAGAEAEAKYWVAGGIYETTEFRVIAGGGEEEWVGPYETIEEAKKTWQDLSWRNVDNALCRYRIERRLNRG